MTWTRQLAPALLPDSSLSMVPAPARGPDVPANLLRILTKSRSLQLKKFPIGFWSYTSLGEHGKYMDEAEVAQWADAGFTVTMGPYLNPNRPEEVRHMHRLLKWADARGMKIIISDPRVLAPLGPLPKDYQTGVKAALKEFNNSPGFFGMHIGDEPGLYSDDFFKAYRIAKEVAPDRHPFVNLFPYVPGAEKQVGYPNWPSYLDAAVTRGNLDFLCYDCYSQMSPGLSGWDQYFENLRVFREAAWRNGVPFWTTLLSVGHHDYRCPNADELRWQFNTAICSGANGILWFFYYLRQPQENYRMSPVDENWNRTQTYYDILRFQKAFHRHYGDLFLRLTSTRVTFSPKAFGGGAVFTPSETVLEISPDRPGHPLLLGEFVDAKGRRYAMLVNNSSSAVVCARITFPGKDVKIYSWDWNGKEKEGGAYATGRIERHIDRLDVWQWLAPGQEVVFRVDSEQARKAKIGTQRP